MELLKIHFLNWISNVIDFVNDVNNKYLMTFNITSFQSTALHMAFRNGNQEIINLLLQQKGINQNIKDIVIIKTFVKFFHVRLMIFKLLLLKKTL